jgi:hypothetical protein
MFRYQKWWGISRQAEQLSAYYETPGSKLSFVHIREGLAVLRNVKVCVVPQLNGPLDTFPLNSVICSIGFQLGAVPPGRQAVCFCLFRRNGIQHSKSDIMITTGLTVCISLQSRVLFVKLQAGRPRGRSSSPSGGKNFHFSTSSRPALGSTQPPIQWVSGFFTRG